jgi:hypothetical protein
MSEQYEYAVGVSSKEDGTTTIAAFSSYVSALQQAQQLLTIPDEQLEDIAEDIGGPITEVFIDRWIRENSDDSMMPDEEFKAVIFHREVSN